MFDQSTRDVKALLPSGLVIKSVNEAAGHVLARIDEATRERDVLVQWDGQVVPW